MQQFELLPAALFRALLLVFAAVLLMLAGIAYVEYSGRGYVYVLFTLVSNYMLWLGFRKKAIYFDTFIGVLLWLGLWLKLTIRVGFFGGHFVESTGSFDGSGAGFDRGLLVSTCGLLALIAASLLRERFFCYRGIPTKEPVQQGLYVLYQKHRGLILIAFALLCAGVAITNINYGIYQRGQVPQTILPYGLSGVYKWLLQYGLASFGALILHFEYVLAKRKSMLGWTLALFEGFTSNVSLLSRGMVLNWSALFYGFIQSRKSSKLNIRLRFLLVVVTLFLALFGGTVLSVNYLRYHGSFKNAAQEFSSERGEAETARDSRLINSMGKSLFIDRWVGMEGVLAVTSSGKTSWELWRQGWREIYSDNRTSFFDLNLIDSAYLQADTNIHHYISLPGVIAFCFYPGSFLFLFACLFLVGCIGGAMEALVYYAGGKNLILCSLFAEVIAYRFSGFGYVPSQSYLLFGSLLLNLLLIYGCNNLLSRRLSGVSVSPMSHN